MTMTAGLTHVTSSAQTTGIWVRIERQHSPADVWIGPYPSIEAATQAMNGSLLIQALCEQDCLECFVEDTSQAMSDDPITLDCEECGAPAGEPCRVYCTGLAGAVTRPA